MLAVKRLVTSYNFASAKAVSAVFLDGRPNTNQRSYKLSRAKYSLLGRLIATFYNRGQ